MVKTLGLVSCTKKKRSVTCTVREMYSSSQLFSKAYAYAVTNYDEVMILSAKHGLIDPDTVIEPYDATLNKMGKEERRKWAEGVNKQIYDRYFGTDMRFVFFHAGLRYREFLIPSLEMNGFECRVPLEGLGIGKQMKWYNEQSNHRLDLRL